ncbi:MAG: hypothetical protein R2686_07150 [Candidatus Nanopelagicales bacterium]
MSVSSKQLLRGLDEVEARLDKVSRAADNLRPVWPEVGRLWADRENTVFASNGLGRWAPEAIVTMRTNQSPLVDTGVMRDGLTRAAAIWEKDHGAAWGASRHDRRVFNIAVFHTYGTSRMPKRIPVPPLRAAERRAWVGLIRKHMHKAITR